MKTKKSQALERIIALMNESFDAEDIMKLAIKAVDMVMERLEALGYGKDD